MAKWGRQKASLSPVRGEFRKATRSFYSLKRGRCCPSMQKDSSVSHPTSHSPQGSEEKPRSGWTQGQQRVSPVCIWQHAKRRCSTPSISQELLQAHKPSFWMLRYLHPPGLGASQQQAPPHLPPSMLRFWLAAP